MKPVTKGNGKSGPGRTDDDESRSTSRTTRAKIRSRTLACPVEPPSAPLDRSGIDLTGFRLAAGEGSEVKSSWLKPSSRVMFLSVSSAFPGPRSSQGEEAAQVHLGADVRAHADDGRTCPRSDLCHKKRPIRPGEEAPRNRTAPEVVRACSMAGRFGRVYSGALDSLQCLAPVGVVDAKVVQRAAVDDQRTAVGVSGRHCRLKTVRAEVFWSGPR
ncbi:hypothetical protein TYRP_023547 [Tyrophagus putrescentiae]|nr:hypothetical protein TYRP_023547 [Tyrophagus putrescentiae]